MDEVMLQEIRNMQNQFREMSAVMMRWMDMQGTLNTDQQKKTHNSQKKTVSLPSVLLNSNKFLRAYPLPPNNPLPNDATE